MRVKNKDYIVVTAPELVDHKIDIPMEIEDDVQDLYTKALRGKNSAKDKLLKLIKRYPKLPVLKNYLVSWYSAKDMNAEASRLNDELLRQHPGYIFAMVYKVCELVEDGKVEEAGAYLKYQTDIEFLYPERKVFHITEIRAFVSATVSYLAASYRFEEAEAQMAFLGEIETNMDVMAVLSRTIVRYRYEQRMQQMKEAREKEIAAKEKTTFSLPAKDVEFEALYPQFEYLYGVQWDIDEELLRDQMLNDREALMAELLHALRMAIAGYRYMSQRGIWNPVVLHALLILPYLDDEGAFADVLEFLGQPAECSNYWMLDWEGDILMPYFKQYSKEKVQQIYDFVAESPGVTASKMSILNLLPGFAVGKPEARDELVEVVRRLLAYFIANREDEHLFDSDVLACIVGTAVDLKATELMDVIEDLYEKEWVSVMLEGDLDEVKERLYNDERTVNVRFFDDVIEHLAHIHDQARQNKEQWGDEDDEDSEDRDEEDDEDELPVMHNTPRNAPCPCGSGKKYKRCHGK